MCWLLTSTDSGGRARRRRECADSESQREAVATVLISICRGLSPKPQLLGHISRFEALPLTPPAKEALQRDASEVRREQRIAGWLPQSGRGAERRHGVALADRQSRPCRGLRRSRSPAAPRRVRAALGERARVPALARFLAMRNSSSLASGPPSRARSACATSGRGGRAQVRAPPARRAEGHPAGAARYCDARARSAFATAPSALRRHRRALTAATVMATSMNAAAPMAMACRVVPAATVGAIEAHNARYALRGLRCVRRCIHHALLAPSVALSAAPRSATAAAVVTLMFVALLRSASAPHSRKPTSQPPETPTVAAASGVPRAGLGRSPSRCLRRGLSRVRRVRRTSRGTGGRAGTRSIARG
jgi:hypothetical protein